MDGRQVRVAALAELTTWMTSPSGASRWRRIRAGRSRPIHREIPVERQVMDPPAVT
jgi:hypothetical protein